MAMSASVRRARGSRAKSSAAGAPARSSLMNVGRRVDYALRALCYLAAQDDHRVVTCTEIQARQGVPVHFLSKILRRLVAAGLLESVPGARGGFRLGRPAERISVREVYECIEGQLSLIDCVDRRDDFCCFASVCAQREVWRGAQQVLLDYLDGISVRQIADRTGLVARLEGAPNGSTARS
jgi:Rrf2 family protein